jgi:5-methylcytosine-specific restriction endonuclease McrA
MSYPADWDRHRRAAYARDDYTCRNCGARGGAHGDAALHAHHIVPAASGGTHEPSNLSALCAEFHVATHNEGVTAPTYIAP